MGVIIQTMGNFNRNNRQNFGDRNSNRPMFSATCSKCGKSCELPFRPNGRKPVFCSQCFEDNGGGSARIYEDINTRRPSFRDRRNSSRSNFGDREMFDAVCDKCGKNCKLPFLPTSGKPIYCSECFEEKNSSRNDGAQKSQLKEEIKILNQKLDRILKLLTPVEVRKEVKVEKVEEKKVEKKKKTVKKKAAVKKESK